MSDGFLQNQTLDVSDDRNIVLTNTVNTDELEKENYEERKETQKGKSFRHVCSIPFFEFQRDPLLKQYLFYSEAKEGDAARRVLRQFLALNPQYRTNDDAF